MPLPCPVCAELRHLADAVGDDAALRLVEAYGGTWVYVPRAIAPGHAIAGEIGAGPAAALAAAFGPGKLYVPLARFWLVRVYRLQGMGAVGIARRLRCTEKAVRAILRGWGACPAAGPLTGPAAAPLGAAA